LALPIGQPFENLMNYIFNYKEIKLWATVKFNYERKKYHDYDFSGKVLSLLFIPSLRCFFSFTEIVFRCILATDMSRHNEILNSFKSILPNFDWLSQSHRDLLMMILIKTSDISNEARPLDVASKWIDCLFEEFFNQVFLFLTPLLQYYGY